MNASRTLKLCRRMALYICQRHIEYLSVLRALSRRQFSEPRQGSVASIKTALSDRHLPDPDPNLCHYSHSTEEQSGVFWRKPLERLACWRSHRWQRDNIPLPRIPGCLRLLTFLFICTSFNLNSGSQTWLEQTRGIKRCMLEPSFSPPRYA